MRGHATRLKSGDCRLSQPSVTGLTGDTLILTPRMPSASISARSPSDAFSSTFDIVMMPPSALGGILAVIANISVGKLLIAIVMPGFLLALVYVVRRRRHQACRGGWHRLNRTYLFH